MHGFAGVNLVETLPTVWPTETLFGTKMLNYRKSMRLLNRQFGSSFFFTHLWSLGYARAWWWKVVGAVRRGMRSKRKPSSLSFESLTYDSHIQFGLVYIFCTAPCFCIKWFNGAPLMHALWVRK